MKFEINTLREVNAVTLKVEAGVRYWEDATVDGIEDVEGKIPCRNGELWAPLIDIDSGIILNWEKGKSADVHYKVCDSGSYFLLDEEGEIIAAIESDYVPSLLCPSRNGYGDYIIMHIDADGKIDNWKADLSDFNDLDED